MFIWRSLRVKEGRIEEIDGWETLGAVVWEMACSSWEEPGNDWLSYIVDDATGQVVATAIFGPEMELLVTLADGRRMRFPEPEFYRTAVEKGG